MRRSELSEMTRFVGGSVFPYPECGYMATKAMYFGVPFKLCANDACALVWGRLDFMIPILLWLDPSEHGWVFIRYENYWHCLWEFVTGKIARKETD